MRHPVIVCMTGAAVLYPVFGNKRKENGMPAKAMVSRTDHTPKRLREPAPGRRFRDHRHR